MVIVEGLVYCYLDCQVICGLVGVRVGVVGFGFVVACRAVSMCECVIYVPVTDQLPGCPLVVPRRNISGLCRQCRSKALAWTMLTGISPSISRLVASCPIEDEAAVVSRQSLAQGNGGDFLLAARSGDATFGRIDRHAKPCRSAPFPTLKDHGQELLLVPDLQRLQFLDFSVYRRRLVMIHPSLKNQDLHRSRHIRNQNRLMVVCFETAI